MLLPDKALSAVEARIYMSDMYETRANIYNHIADPHSLDSVLLHGADDFITDSTLEKLIRTFKEEDIYDHFGLNLLEFLSLPCDVLEFIVDLNRKDREKDAKAVEKRLRKDLDL